MALEDVKHWQVGDVRITRIVELARFRDDIGMLLKDATPEILAPHLSWLKPHFVLDDGHILMQWQAFAVQTPTRTMMIDTCIGNDRQRFFNIFSDMQTSFLEDLIASGIDPAKVDTVCCTHLHYDHVGWNTRLVDGKWVPTFPNAKYLFDTTEYAEIRDLQKANDWHAGHLSDSIDPIVAAGLHEFIPAPGYHVCDEIWMEHTPGHTSGHCAIHIESKGEHAIITGDLMHHPVQCAIPHHHSNFDHYPEVAVNTRVKFMGDVGQGRILVIGSHFSDPTAGWIVPDGDAWRFVTEQPEI